MGSFAFTKADNLTLTANIPCESGFKFLIPEQYGGGFIKDFYRDYGKLGKNSNAQEPMYDMYEILAQWNRHNLPVYDVFESDPKTNLNKLKPIDEYTDNNRSIGIWLHSSPRPIEFPLKLVSPTCKLKYEEVEGISIPDPHQGFWKLPRYSADFNALIVRYASGYRKAGYGEFGDKLIDYYKVTGSHLTKYREGTI